MREIHLRPFEHSKDTTKLDKLRWQYQEADLEVPKGYVAEGVNTGIAEKWQENSAPEFTAALTSTLAMIHDPFIKNPKASRLDVMQALIKLESAMSLIGQSNGAVDAYIAIPDQLTDYQELVQKYGYKPTVEHCTVFRRPLRPDTEPLIGTVRDAVAGQSKENV